MTSDTKQPLCIRKVVQTSSGGDHVTIYDSTLRFVNSPGVTVVLAADAVVDDRHAPSDYMQLALNAIEEGADRALRPTGQGAHIEVTKLVLHPVDFKPFMFRKLTEDAVAHMAASQSGGGGADG